jgi:hypothetical protein
MALRRAVSELPRALRPWQEPDRGPDSWLCSSNGFTDDGLSDAQNHDAAHPASR